MIMTTFLQKNLLTGVVVTVIAKATADTHTTTLSMAASTHMLPHS